MVSISAAVRQVKDDLPRCERSIEVSRLLSH